MKTIKKHRNFPIKALLVFYLFFLGFATYHEYCFHTYDIRLYTSLDAEDTVKIFDAFMDKDATCRLVVFATSLYTNNQCITYQNKNLVQLFISENSNQSIQSELFQTKDLRAPPTSIHI